MSERPDLKLVENTFGVHTSDNKLPKVIGVAGRARSGKDSIGKFLIDKYKYTRYAFADPIKHALSKMFGLPVRDFYDDERKEIPHAFWGISPREMAQKLGTEGGRMLFREDIWIKRAELQLKSFPRKYVITDVRFENEAEFIRENEGVLIHVVRPELGDGVVNEHVSENGVEIVEGDHVIFNDGTLSELYFKVTKVLQKGNG